MGEANISKLVYEILAIGRDRIIQHEELKLKKAEAKNDSQGAKDVQTWSSTHRSIVYINSPVFLSIYFFYHFNFLQ